MPAINNTHLYDGAVYKGHNLNGVIPVNHLLFDHYNHVTIEYIDTSTNKSVYTKSLNIEYNRQNNVNIFNLPFLQNNAGILSNYTDQYHDADLSKMLNPSDTLGIADLEVFNNKLIITYNVAPIKQGD